MRNTDGTQYLRQRNGIYQYYREVPADLRDHYGGQRFIAQTLKTRNLKAALTARDNKNRQIELEWRRLRSVGPVDDYQAAVDAADSMGLVYLEAARIAAESTLEDILKRIEIVSTSSAPQEAATVLLGDIKQPQLRVREAFDFYVEEIAKDDWRNKSDAQRYQWRKIKQRAVNNFVAAVSNKPLLQITNDDALKFYKFWQGKIDRGEAGANAANRDMGNMRKFYREYNRHSGNLDRTTPFDPFTFKDSLKKHRPPFSVEWIRSKLLDPLMLAKLNPQARDIFLTLIDTGARPSEISNLLPENIVLDGEVPFIKIAPTDNREIKTHTSVREVPLVGLALDAMRRNPEGFPKYRDRDNTLSAVLMKWLRVNELQETPEHKVYSLRHSFEDRAKEAGIDEEVRKILVGHAIDRPRYGTGGTRVWKRDEMLKLVF